VSTTIKPPNLNYLKPMQHFVSTIFAAPNIYSLKSKVIVNKTRTPS
jgi:hypothetical protein